MTAAGSAEVAYRVEADYQTAGIGDWVQPGVNVTVGDLTINNQATRVRQPDDPTSDRSVPGNLNGSASVSFTLTDKNLLTDLVPGFADTGTLSSASGTVPTAEWYFNATAIDNNLAEFDDKITASGAHLESVTVNYSEGQDVTVDVQIAFASVSDSEPTSIVQPNAADVFTHHGTSLTIGGVSQSGLQSATLTLSSLSRLQQDASREGRAAVVGAIEPELQAEAIFSEVDQLERAIGLNGTSVRQTLESAGTGSLSLQNGTNQTISFELIDPQPVNYAWSSLVEPGADLTEPTTYHLHDVGV